MSVFEWENPPNVTIKVLKHLSTDSFIVRVQADLDHVVHCVLTPFIVLSCLVEVS